jgi:hypothetical protein
MTDYAESAPDTHRAAALRAEIGSWSRSLNADRPPHIKALVAVTIARLEAELFGLTGEQPSIDLAAAEAQYAGFVGASRRLAGVPQFSHQLNTSGAFMRRQHVPATELINDRPKAIGPVCMRAGLR